MKSCFSRRNRRSNVGRSKIIYSREDLKFKNILRNDEELSCHSPREVQFKANISPIRKELEDLTIFPQLSEDQRIKRGRSTARSGYNEKK